MMATDVEPGGPPRGHLLRETAISAIINGVLSAGFYVLLFGGLRKVPAWGAGGLVADTAVQSFMVAMMGSLVPGLLAMRAWRTSRAATPGAGTILGWSLLTAVLAAAGGAGLAAAAFTIFSIGDVPYTPGLAGKVVYGMALALVVTPAMLGRIWRRAAPHSPG